MTEFRSGDRVIVTNARGQEHIGTVERYRSELAYTDQYDVKFDQSGMSVPIPATLMRLKAASTSTAKGIVDKLQEIQKLRKQVDTAYADLIGLLALDGQPEHEQRRFENMRIAHKTILHRDIVADLTAWEGFLEARKKR